MEKNNLIHFVKNEYNLKKKLESLRRINERIGITKENIKFIELLNNFM